MVRSVLSGVTPGQREELTFRRVRGRCATTHFSSRKVRLVGALCRVTMPNLSVIRVLARAFLAGEQTLEQIILRGSQTLGRPWRWLRPVAQRYLRSIAGRIRPRNRDVVQFIRQDHAFQQTLQKHGQTISVQQWLIEPNIMHPAPIAQSWTLPPIESVGALADWLWLEYGQLDWFADLKGLGCRGGRTKLQHYHYRVLPKPFGSTRLIEAPKRRVKKLQQEILSGILEKVPPHPAAHGFIKGRSIKTFVTPHVGQRVVLRMDLCDFFVSIGAARVQTLFRLLGYPEPVADLLGGLCTNAVPKSVWNAPDLDFDAAHIQELRTLYSRPHLPQGAPTSPALANVCAYRLDCRLTGLAKAVDATYTRYADDLAFSGSGLFERRVESFSTSVAAILLEEGFRVHHRKTRMMRQGVQQYLAGLVVNEKSSVPRTDFDSLKATLTNCVRLGPESQNRDAHPDFRSHLQGKIAFFEMVNAEKAKRLRSVFDRIHWT